MAKIHIYHSDDETIIGGSKKQIFADYFSDGYRQLDDYEYYYVDHKSNFVVATETRLLYVKKV